ncbi:unnamed protein product [Angiostrongylus costaricensis]|uniref:Ribosomal_S10 domain-containing protein n=1 Tax=Angiostrongylus costaricensis TaxID=334426 RepID=A0A0R3PHN5_ANGCS|nr:unnamed protein product [Angiostrongylus costaricensis]
MKFVLARLRPCSVPNRSSMVKKMRLTITHEDTTPSEKNS